MKVRLTFKTPDVIDYAISDALPECPEDFEEATDMDREDMRDEIKDACKKWVRCEEYLTVEIDTETGTCTPIPA